MDRDRVRGMIFGHALGDAVGLTAEFSSKKAPQHVQFPYSEAVRGFPLCDWTDETDQLIVVMRVVTSSYGQLSRTFVQEVASGLYEWVTSGFSELGDSAGTGVSGVMKMLVGCEGYIDDPHHSAVAIWEKSGGKVATNESIVQSSILGALPVGETASITLPELIEKTVQLTRCTTADAKCGTACSIHVQIINGLIYGLAGLQTPSDIDNLLTSAVTNARELLPAEQHEELSRMIETAYTKSIADLKLGDLSKVSHVYKALSCGLYALQVIKTAMAHNTRLDFKKVICHIAGQGGDADANGAIAGAVLGAYLGYSRLPQDWINAVPNSQWLMKQIDDFIHALESHGQTLAQLNSGLAIGPGQKNN